LLSAEAAFHRGDFLGAAAVLTRVHEEAHAQGYVNEALHAGLLEAALRRARGEIAAADELVAGLLERTLARGDERAGEALRVVLERLRGDATISCTSSLTRRLHFDEPASLRVSRSDGTWWMTETQLDHLDRASARMIVDLVGQRIVVDGHVQDMRRRETLLPIVRALLTAPGMRLSPDSLVQQAWGFEYNRLHHGSRLSMAMTRLRKLLGHELFVGTRDSYALIPLRPWMLVEPR
jgi:hypothetical protein